MADGKQQRFLSLLDKVTQQGGAMARWGCVIVAIASGFVAMPGLAATLAAAIGGGVLATLLDKIAKGDSVSDAEILDALKSGNIQTALDKLDPAARLQIEAIDANMRKAVLPVGDAVVLSSQLSSDQHAVMQSQLAEILKLFQSINSPMAVAERHYCEAVVNELDKLDLIGLPEHEDEHQRQSLRVSYISLYAEHHRKREETGKHAVAGREAMEEQAQEPISVEDAVRGSRRLVIRGDAGAGKTTLLKWIAVQAATECGVGIPDRESLFPGERPVPFYLALRNYAGDNQNLPRANELARETTTNWDPPAPNWCHEILKTGRAVVLVDGLDELSDEKRRAAFAWLRDLARDFTNARFVVSSRPYALSKWKAWDEWTEEASFATVSLKAMLLPQVDEFIDQWHDAAGRLLTDPRERAELPELRDSIKTVVHTESNLRELAETPLLCAMICILNREQHGQIERTRGSLYDDMIDVLLRDRDRGRGIAGGEPPVSKRERRGLARHLAFHMLSVVRADIDEAVLDRFFDELTGLRADLSGEHVRNLLANRCALLRSPAEKRYNFRHKTFQEFLAADYLAALRDVDFLVTHSVSADWRNTIWLASEILLPDDLVSLRTRATAEFEKPGAAVQQRVNVGITLGLIGDPRNGVGLRADSVPDIVWCNVPAGPFLYGSTEDGKNAYDDEKPQKTIRLDAYHISKYPITYAQFQAFTDAEDGYRNPKWWHSLHNDGLKQQQAGHEDQSFKLDNHPRENVSWYEAMAFCRWLSTKPGYKGARLPTEEEWERAARGIDGRIYPWGNEFDVAKCNTGESGIGQTSAVGLFPDGASPCGAMDMSGNVFEWTLTEYESRDSAKVGSGATRVLRGGSGYDAYFARAAARDGGSPDFRSYVVGFRVASPAEL